MQVKHGHDGSMRASVSRATLARSGAQPGPSTCE